MITRLKQLISYALNYEQDTAELEETIKGLTELYLEQGIRLEETTQELIITKKEVKRLLNKGLINVQELKPWYEERFGVLTWLYDFNSDGRQADVKHSLAVSPSEEHHVTALTEQIINRYNITKEDSPTSIIERVKQYFTVRSHWTYVGDQQEYGRREFWAPANISARTRRGDCDSLAILMHVLINRLFKRFGYEDYYWRLKLTASMVLGEGGHAYNVWLHDDGEWYVIESTYDLEGSFKRAWLKTPLKNNNLYYYFWGFARIDRSFIGEQLESLNKFEGGDE